jgi:hypothetical protein
MYHPRRDLCYENVGSTLSQADANHGRRLRQGGFDTGILELQASASKSFYR